MSDKLHIATGGTIDSIWLPELDTAAPAQSSTSSEYLEWMAENGVEYIGHKQLFLKDSRETTLEDRDLLAAEIAEASATRVLVTSGTFLMPDMAREAAGHNMAKFYQKLGKRVVFTGALTPIKGYEVSDGGFNLGMGVALLGDVEFSTDDTVLATMNGSAITAEKLRKDLTSATFAGVTGADDLLGYGKFTLIPAGGTIDFEEDGMDGLRPSRESVIPTYLRDKVRIRKQFEASQPILKDSRALTTEDMDMVVDVVRASNDEHVLITSGLIKMAELREYVNGALSKNDRERRLILTGSRYILQRSGFTDATFNLGYALGNIGFVKPGVHVAMGGKILNSRQNPFKLVYTPEEQKTLLERHS